MKKFRLVGIVLMVFASFSSHALFLEYKGFYQRLEKLNDDAYQNIEMGFYLTTLPSRKACQIKRAELLSKSGSVDVAFNEKGKLFVPFDETYYKEKAVVDVELVNANDNCTLKMQIQAKSQGRSFTFEQLAVYTQEMDDLMASFGGLLWFMMPDVSGLTFEFSEPTSIAYIDGSLQDKLRCQQNTCQLVVDIDHSAAKKAIEFVASPLVVAPFVDKDK